MNRWIVLLLVNIVGCSVSPEKATKEQIDLHVMQQMSWIETTRVAMDQPITLSDAVILALKHNLEIEQARYKTLIGHTALNNAMLSFLPKVDSNSNRYVRNNEGGAIDVLPPARDKNSSSNTISWSSLDLGQAYLRAHQANNDALIEQQQQRRVMTRIVREVLSAYLDVAAMEEEVMIARDTLNMLDVKLQEARGLEDTDLVDPLLLLQYREQVLQLRVQLQDLEQEFLGTKQDLMTLISAPSVDLPLSHNGLDTLGFSFEDIALSELERFALYHRSDLMESIYQVRNAGLEIKRAWLDAIPNFSIGYSNNYDSDPNLRNNEWFQVDLNLAIKVMELLTLPAKLDELEKKEALEKLTSLANAVAVIGQVRAANIDFQSDRQRLTMQVEREATLQQILTLRSKRLSYELMDELEVYKARVRLIIARVKKAQAHSQYQSSALRMLEQIGVDLFPSTTNVQSDEQLKQVVESWLEALPTRVSTLLSEPHTPLS
ncbi:outer membrane protein [Vibrio maritimus]|uniref:Outer membrane protein n=1 Tax=Vibrio maritimus TaxID=990268 RepID=A0A090S859_9VIBR|nr:outer membrane protein [Vibrio maritimus]